MTTKLSKITYTAVKPVVEALKEGARVVLIAIIPLVIDSLTSNKFEWRSIAVVAAITALRILDKYLHLEGKLEGNSNLTNGLTRF
jgi:hypothetical protein